MKRVALFIKNFHLVSQKYKIGWDYAMMCVHFSFVHTKEKQNQKEKVPATVPVLKILYFSGTKRTRFAQTAFCPYRKNVGFS